MMGTASSQNFVSDERYPLIHNIPLAPALKIAALVGAAISGIGRFSSAFFPRP
jgi:hypothetical protein